MHDPQTYTRYRPRYPAELFAHLANTLGPDAHIVDLGAGTGLSILSMIEAGVPGIFSAVESDEGMLKEARELLPRSRVETIHAPAEATSLPDAYADVITIASAYHWMNRPQVDREMLRLLKPGGRIQIFEYQFPKAEGQPELNEWIRRQFNTLWKFPDQKPRGSLRQLVEPLVRHPEVKSVLEVRDFAPVCDSFTLDLRLDELVGLIFSQARTLSYLHRLPDETSRALHQEAVAGQLAQYWPPETVTEFRFKLAGVLLTRDFAPQEK